jgi:hypothetical protein
MSVAPAHSASESKLAECSGGVHAVPAVDLSPPGAGRRDALAADQLFVAPLANAEDEAPAP